MTLDLIHDNVYEISIGQAYNKQYTDGYATNKIRFITCHEPGHALGLADVGLWDDVLMNGFTGGEGSRYDTYGIYTPQEDDEDGINFIY